MSGEDGYQPLTGNGPRVRTDVVDVYVFRRVRRRTGAKPTLQILQLLRTGAPLAETWHPVMGHIEAGETAAACAIRELSEEVGLEARAPECRGLWALEQVHPFYIAKIDTIVMSPRFAAEVTSTWKPRLNEEHGRARWVNAKDAAKGFMWPGQVAACREIVGMFGGGRALAEPWVRVER